LRCRAMALAALISFEKMRTAPAVNIAAMTKSSRTTNHIGRTDGRPFPLPSLARIVTVRILHDFLRVNYRHIGFSAALENLRWVRNISRTKPDASGGRFTSRHGNAAVCRSVVIAECTASQTQHLHVGCARSPTRKRPKFVRKTLKSETEHDERRRQRRGRPFKLTANKRNQAVQAFWAMHVETLNWSGMTLTHYAAAEVQPSPLARPDRRWRGRN